MATSTAGTSDRIRSFLRVGAPFVAILVFIGISQRIEVGRSAIIEAQETWEEMGPDAYEMTYTYRDLGTATLEYRDGAVVAYRTDDPRLEDAEIYWVDELFHLLRVTAESFDGQVKLVQFHPTLGYPVRATIDPDMNEDGDEWTFEVIDLEPLP